MAAPKTNIKMVTTPHFFISFPTKNILAVTNPKKKDHNKTGSCSNNQLTRVAKEKRLINMPIKRANKKFPFSCFQKALKPSFCKVFNKEIFMLFMEEISSS